MSLIKKLFKILFWTANQRTESTSTTAETAPESTVSPAAIETAASVTLAVTLDSMLEPLFGFIPEMRRFIGGLDPLAKEINAYQKEIRATVCFVVDIMQVATKKAFFCRVFSYLDTICPKLSADLLKTTIAAEFGDVTLDSQAGEEWLDQVKWVINNWKVASNSPLRKSLHKLTGFLAWAIIGNQVPEGDLAKNFGVMYETCGLKSVDALDFPAHVMECFVTIFENVRDAIRTGSFMALFGASESSLASLEIEHARLMAYVQPFMLGTLEMQPKPTTRQQFLRDLERHIELLTRQLKTAKGPIHQAFSRMHLNAMQRYSDVSDFNRASFARMTAYGLCVWGPSGVAKSTFLPILSTSLLRANGYEEEKGGTDPLLVGSHNATDKYHSGLKGSDLIAVLDDLGNTQPAHCEGDPSSILLDTINTAPRLMNKAEVEQKGRVPFAAPFVIVTTNDRTMGAAEYSVSATSRLRRIAVYIEVSIKPQFRQEGTSMLDPRKVPPGDPDIWNFNLTTYRPLPGRSEGTVEPGNWVPIKHLFAGAADEVALTGIGIADLLAFLAEDSQAHFALERRLMTQNNNYHIRPSCPHGGLGGLLCRSCSALTVQGIWDFVRRGREQESPVETPPEPARFGLPQADLPFAAPSVEEIDRVLCVPDSRRAEAAACMDAILARSRIATRTALFGDVAEPYLFWGLRVSMGRLHCDADRLLATRPLLFVALAFVHAMFVSWLFLWFGVGWFVRPTTAFVSVLISWAGIVYCNVGPVKFYIWDNMEKVAAALARRKLKSFWDSRGRTLTRLIALLTVCYAGYRLLSKVYGWLHDSSQTIAPPKPRLAHQGGVLTTPSVPEEPTRPWQDFKCEAVPVGRVASTMSCAQGLERIRHAHAWGTFIGPVMADGVTRKRIRVSVTGVRNGIFLVPTHVKSKTGGFPMDVTLEFDVPRVGGTTFKALIGHEAWADIPQKDISLVDIPVGRMMRDNLDLFPLQLPTLSLGVRAIRRVEGGELKHEAMFARVGPVQMPDTDMDTTALEYATAGPTGPGYCGMLLFADRQPTFIAGIHVAGENGTPRGVASCITRRQIEEALNQLKVSGVVPIMPKFTQIDLSLNGVVKLNPSDVVPPKSCTRFMHKDSEYTYLGSHTKGTRSFHSQVVETRCAAQVVEIFPKAERIFGPPRNLSNARSWTHNLQLAAEPARISPEAIALAEKDGEVKWRRIFEQDPDFASQLGVTDDSTAINGINGQAEYSPIDMKTSQGWPVNRPKTELFYKTGVPTATVIDPWVATPQFYEDARTLEDVLAQSEYVPFVFRASLKDEPTKKTKEWPRMFSGAPVMYVFLMRKYFATIFAYMKRNKFAFGGMCGINAYSTEWSTMTRFVTAFGRKRIVAGDFAHFDKKMMRVIIRKLLGRILWVAKMSGVYTPRQLHIMEVLTASLVWCITEVNGELYLIGGNPSGHTVTVELNDMYNEFILACVFYTLMLRQPPAQRPKLAMVEYEADSDSFSSAAVSSVGDIPLAEDEQIVPGVDGLFSAFVHLVTYGDDNLMGVATCCSWFNHTSIAEVFAEWGITYTMADKTSDSVPYIDISDATFLKRSMRWDERNQEWMAPLEELSMLKALMVRDSSSALSHDEHIAVNIMNLMREAYFHGEEVYADYKSKAERFVTQLGLWHHFPDGRLKTFEETQDWWERTQRLPGLTAQSLEDELGVDSGEEDIARFGWDYVPGNEWSAEVCSQLVIWDWQSPGFRAPGRMRQVGPQVYVLGLGMQSVADTRSLVDAVMSLGRMKQAVVLCNHAGVGRVLVMQLTCNTMPAQLWRYIQSTHCGWHRNMVGVLGTPLNGMSAGSFATICDLFYSTMRYQRGIQYRTDGRVFDFVWRDMLPWNMRPVDELDRGLPEELDIPDRPASRMSSGPSTC